MVEFIGGEVRPELTRQVRACRSRRTVAVAYLGADAIDVLPLRRHDMLVVAATEANAAAGAINPDSLQTYLEHGVEIWSHPSLHAKVLRLGAVTVVGSANASPTSTRLEEAVTVSSSKTIAAKADAFIAELIEDSVLVDEHLIAGLRAAWARRKRRRAPEPKVRAWPRPDQRVFVFQSVEAPLTPSERRALGDNEGRWSRRVGAKSHWFLEHHVGDLGDLRRFRAGDIIVYDHSPVEGPRELWAPVEALTEAIRVPRTGSGIVPLRARNDLEPIDYVGADGEFRRRTGRSIGRARLLKDQRSVDALLGLFGLPTTALDRPSGDR